MTKDEIIKQRYPFYNPDIEEEDIEINAEAVKELMEAYFIEQLKRLAEDLEQVHPECIIERIKTVARQLRLTPQYTQQKNENSRRNERNERI